MPTPSYMQDPDPQTLSALARCIDELHSSSPQCYTGLFSPVPINVIPVLRGSSKPSYPKWTTTRKGQQQRSSDSSVSSSSVRHCQVSHSGLSRSVSPGMTGGCHPARGTSHSARFDDCGQRSSTTTTSYSSIRVSPVQWQWTSTTKSTPTFLQDAIRRYTKTNSTDVGSGGRSGSAAGDHGCRYTSLHLFERSQSAAPHRSSKTLACCGTPSSSLSPLSRQCGVARSQDTSSQWNPNSSSPLLSSAPSMTARGWAAADDLRSYRSSSTPLRRGSPQPPSTDVRRTSIESLSSTNASASCSMRRFSRRPVAPESSSDDSMQHCRAPSQVAVDFVACTQRQINQKRLPETIWETHQPYLNNPRQQELGSSMHEKVKPKDENVWPSMHTSSLDPQRAVMSEEGLRDHLCCLQQLTGEAMSSSLLSPTERYAFLVESARLLSSSVLALTSTDVVAKEQLCQSSAKTLGETAGLLEGCVRYRNPRPASSSEHSNTCSAVLVQSRSSVERGASECSSCTVLCASHNQPFRGLRRRHAAATPSVHQGGSLSAGNRHFDGPDTVVQEEAQSLDEMTLQKSATEHWLSGDAAVVARQSLRVVAAADGSDCPLSSSGMTGVPAQHTSVERATESRRWREGSATPQHSSFITVSPPSTSSIFNDPDTMRPCDAGSLSGICTAEETQRKLAEVDPPMRIPASLHARGETGVPSPHRDPCTTVPSLFHTKAHPLSQGGRSSFVNATAASIAPNHPSRYLHYITPTKQMCPAKAAPILPDGDGCISASTRGDSKRKSGEATAESAGLSRQLFTELTTACPTADVVRSLLEASPLPTFANQSANAQLGQRHTARPVQQAEKEQLVLEKEERQSDVSSSIVIGSTATDGCAERLWGSEQTEESPPRRVRVCYSGATSFSSAVSDASGCSFGEDIAVGTGINDDDQVTRRNRDSSVEEAVEGENNQREQQPKRLFRPGVGDKKEGISSVSGSHHRSIEASSQHYKGTSPLAVSENGTCFAVTQGTDSNASVDRESFPYSEARASLLCTGKMTRRSQNNKWDLPTQEHHAGEMEMEKEGCAAAISFHPLTSPSTGRRSIFQGLRSNAPCLSRVPHLGQDVCTDFHAKMGALQSLCTSKPVPTVMVKSSADPDWLESTGAAGSSLTPAASAESASIVPLDMVHEENALAGATAGDSDPGTAHERTFGEVSSHLESTARCSGSAESSLSETNMNQNTYDSVFTDNVCESPDGSPRMAGDHAPSPHVLGLGVATVALLPFRTASCAEPLSQAASYMLYPSKTLPNHCLETGDTIDGTHDRNVIQQSRSSRSDHITEDRVTNGCYDDDFDDDTGYCSYGYGDAIISL